ncbi:hypothetical protein [Sphingobacterium paludis]|uniref:Uncharacterized protein n=1 Tax=Sphingobacterium paludis TaxID=1476465 RepID=A0A4R7CZL3_9SPHI|nr:hypothetical protein [Sphingobacterium paludis]TDS13830.1 hypothetical protein B0I21_104156 [Sphingobacterium paludis]
MNFHIHKNKRPKNKISKAYTAPESIVTMVHMEMGLAASSTTVTPTNSGNQVREQFDLQEQERELDW